MARWRGWHHGAQAAPCVVAAISTARIVMAAQQAWQHQHIIMPRAAKPISARWRGNGVASASEKWRRRRIDVSKRGGGGGIGSMQHGSMCK